MQQTKRSAKSATNLFLALLCFLSCLPLVATAQSEALSTPANSFLLRVENAQFGRIEASLDRGKSFFLIGRVQRPATNQASERNAKTVGEVFQSTGSIIAFTSAKGRILRLRSEPSPSRQRGGSSGRISDSEVGTDLEPDKGLFGGLAPPVKSEVRLQTGNRDPSPFPNEYVAALGDSFVFTVPIPLRKSRDGAVVPIQNRLKSRFDEVSTTLALQSKSYQDGAIDRAKRQKRKIVAGRLRLVLKLPSDEPEPITAVSYSIDGEVVALHNSLPSVLDWDTTSLSNGEHVFEIRALNKYTTLVTAMRILVVVNNENRNFAP